MRRNQLGERAAGLKVVGKKSNLVNGRDGPLSTALTPAHRRVH